MVRKQASQQQPHRRDLTTANSNTISSSSRTLNGRVYHEVDDRITIPLGVSTPTSASATLPSTMATPTSTLRSGIDQYRTLQGRAAPSTATASVSSMMATTPSVTTFKNSMVSAMRQNSTTTTASTTIVKEPPQDRAKKLMELKQYAAALPLYTEAIQNTASSAQAKLKLFYHRGSCALLAKKYQQAVDDLTHVIDLTPSNQMLLAKRAKAHAALNHHHNALSDYNDAIAMTAPTHRELRGLLMARAQVYQKMNNIGAALDDLALAQSGTHGGDRDPELFYQRAQLHIQCRQLALAVADLDEFMDRQEEENWNQQDPEFSRDDDVDDDNDTGRRRDNSVDANASDHQMRLVDVRLERAELLLKLAAEAEQKSHKDDELLAIEEGEQQPLLGHQYTSSDYHTSTSSRSTSSTSVAKPSTVVSADVDGGGPLRVATAVDTNNSTTTNKTKKKAFAIKVYRGRESVELVERAIHDYTEVLRVDAGHLDAMRFRGDCLALIDRAEDALRDYDAALQVDPLDFHVQMARARLLFSQHHVARAIEVMTRVLEVNGFFVDALFLRAEMYEAQGELDKATADYTAIVDVRGGASGASTTGGGGGGGGGAVAPTSKVLSPYAIQALMMRARVAQEKHEYELAAQDYQRILESCPNEVEAQYELQENGEKKKVYEKQREADALAWLTKKMLEENAEGGGASGSGGAGGGGGSTTPASNSGGASKNKKKKKNAKKKNKTGGAVATAIVAVDPSVDEEDASTAAIMEEARSKEIAVKDEERIDHATNGLQRRSSHHDIAIKGEGSKMVSAPLVKKSSFSSVSIVVTRDEACESMWEENVEEMRPLYKRGKSPRDRYPLRIEDDTVEDHGVGELHAGNNALRILHTSAAATDDEDEEPDVEEPTPLEVVTTTHEEEHGEQEEGKENPTGSPSAVSSSSTPSHVAIRERLVDERYLRKRQKQLDKLRSQLVEACEARNREMIEETLARAERKQMAEALEEEIGKARLVVEEMEKERSRLEAENAKQARYRQQEQDRERRKRRVKQEEDEKEQAVAKEKEKEKEEGVEEWEEGRGEDGPLQLSSAPAEGTSTSPSASSSPTTPSLVIRPIAYGHALHLAEQHQQQILQFQRLVEEKEAEISYLRAQLAVGNSRPQTHRHRQEEEEEDAREVNNSKSLLLSSHHTKELAAAAGRVDTLIQWMGPSGDADDVRFRILSFVRRVLERHWASAMMTSGAGGAMGMALAAPPLVFVATGSFPMKTYLPSADLDVCLFLPKELEPTWHFAVMNALCLAGTTTTSASASSSTTTTAVKSGEDTGGASGAAVMTMGTAIATGVPLDGNVLASSSPASLPSSAGGSSSSHTVRNVSFINAEVRVIKCTIDNVQVDVTANRVGALGALLVLDAMDQCVGENHLLKRSIVLIKSWCMYESGAYMGEASTTGGAAGGAGADGGAATGASQQSVLGASQGAFSTYAINTIVMSLFNELGPLISSPLHALLLFLDKMAEFPWHESALTVFGAVPLNALASGGSLAVALQRSTTKSSSGRERGGGLRSTHTTMMALEDVDHIRRHVHEQFGGLDPSFTPSSSVGTTTTAATAVAAAAATSSSPPPSSASSSSSVFPKKMFPIRACNVVDPLDEHNNLARSVSLELFPSMKRAFTRGRNRLQRMLSSSSSSPSKEVAEDTVDDFFATCWRTYGRGDGWRPDLLVHPRQKTWRSTSAPLRVSSSTEDATRWQSLLPEFLRVPPPPSAAATIAAGYPVNGGVGGGGLHQQQHYHHQQQVQHQQHHHPLHPHLHHYQQQQHHATHHQAQHPYQPYYQQQRMVIGSSSLNGITVGNRGGSSSGGSGGGGGGGFGGGAAASAAAFGGGGGAHVFHANNGHSLHYSPSHYPPYRSGGGGTSGGGGASSSTAIRASPTSSFSSSPSSYKSSPRRTQSLPGPSLSTASVAAAAAMAAAALSSAASVSSVSSPSTISSPPPRGSMDQNPLHSGGRTHHHHHKHPSTRRTFDSPTTRTTSSTTTTIKEKDGGGGGGGRGRGGTSGEPKRI